MTAKQIWKRHYRSLRVIRREANQASVDLLIYGTGMVLVPKDGEPRRIPPSQWSNYL